MSATNTTPIPLAPNPPSRFTEPSTWAGISAALATLATQVPTQYSPYVAIGAALAAAVGVFLREAGNKPRALAAIDAIESATTAVKTVETASAIQHTPAIL